MADNHLDDRQLLDLAMGRSPRKEAETSRDHHVECRSCRERLERLRPLVEGFVELGEAEEIPAFPSELWRQLSERAEPLLEELCRPAAKRQVPSGRILWRRSWAVASSILLLMGATGGMWFLCSNGVRPAAAAILETTGLMKITQPGQSPRDYRSKRGVLQAGDVLSTPDGNGAIRLDSAAWLSLRQGCRLEAQALNAERQATFKLREGSLCVDTTGAKQGVVIVTPGGTVRCRKGKTHFQVTLPRQCLATPLEGEIVVESSGHVGVVSSGVCAELKRSEPCCYRPARPKETRCDWVNRCGKPKDRRKT